MSIVQADEKCFLTKIHQTKSGFGYVQRSFKTPGDSGSNNSTSKAIRKLCVAVNEYDATDVLEKISFVNPDGNNHLVTYFKHYIRGKGSEDLRKFIIFCSGGYVLPTQPMKVGFYFRESFFASTCFLKLDCPNAFTSFEEFENAFDAAIHTSFNVV